MYIVLIVVVIEIMLFNLKTHTNFSLLSNLLRLPIAPTRVGILKEITRLNLPDVAMECARGLHE